MPQSQISRIERCQQPGVRLSTVDRLFATMGIRYQITIDLPNLAPRRQADLVHARCSAYIGRRLAMSGWQVAREVEIGDGRSRGWIDLLAYHATTQMVVVIEIKTEIHDLGQIERTMNWYQREARSAAARLGWRPIRISSALIVMMSSANEQVLAWNRDVLAKSFPGRANELLDLVNGTLQPAPIQPRHVAMIDPRSHRKRWLRPTRLDGRRSPEPYRDYIDAARSLERGRVSAPI